MITVANTRPTVSSIVQSPDFPKQHFIVLGGGLAGLTAAQALLKKGCTVTLIEKGSQVGGLARTFEKEGFRFDIGGHRFHSNNLTVVNWLKDLLKSDLLTVPRTSHIYLNGQFVDYPIQIAKAISTFSPLKAAHMAVSYLASKVTERQRPEVSFEDWVIKRYGKALYKVFFEPYTEKVWGIPCNELSAAWAAQRISIPSFRKMVQQAIAPAKETPATAISEFYYPRAGFGMIPQALEREILDLGGTIYTNTSVLTCTPTSDGFEVAIQHQDGSHQTLRADQVVSTIPLDALLESIPDEWGSQEISQQYDLEYRDIICLFVALKKPQVSRDSWTYFPLKNLLFGRTHEPKNWSSEMVPDGSYTSLAIEIFASRGESVWQMTDDEILNQVVEQMDQIGWTNKADVHRSWVLRVPYAYPVYRIGYQEKLQAVKNYFSQWPNLHLVGRTGSFHYMNSDGVVEDVFRFIEKTFPETAVEVQPLTSATGRWM
ncbi:FAD-dependent oxidoreductase [Leptolyngbya sp. FACHB-321]|uniref:FAD-dependent oxidoreductase n=1 Tax=Leptolyngbya sp. FACHB-321 TaxID=2692807 RepID=UPI001681F7C9|nr:FAD-dependent oxidoreductase [Leptolyngbya sp. FACHB-321]MBD2036607.1 FAD-dependent oxidoreductase [Leptolyngbya sp. FACHB-321]